MSLNTEFLNAVNSRDVMQIRIMIMTSLIKDLTIHDFDEQLSYAEAHINDLYDEHDGEVFSNDTSTWNKSLLDEQIAKSYLNFSKERVQFTKKIVRYVFPKEAEAADQNEFVKSHSKDGIGPVEVGTGVAVAGAAAAVYGLACSHPFVAAAGVVAVAVGGTVIVKNKK